MAEMFELAREKVMEQGAADATDLAERVVSGAVEDTALPDLMHMIPTWRARDYSTVPVGTPYQYGGQVYKLRQQHDATGSEDWTPPNTPALWYAVAAPGEAGTAEDPVTAVRGMEYEYGIYYKDPEDGKTYLCTRTGEAAGGTVVLQYLPHELIGQSFEAV